MGIADQFKDKAQELADQAKQKKTGGKRDDARQRSSGASDRASDRPGMKDRSGMKGKAQGAAKQARERFDR